MFLLLGLLSWIPNGSDVLLTVLKVTELHVANHGSQPDNFSFSWST